MSREFDPLKLLPSADVVRRKLRETERLQRKLVILLDITERIEREAGDGEAAAAAETGMAGVG